MTDQEKLDLLREMQKRNEDKAQKPCPSCGHCPACNRPQAHPRAIPMPYQPYPPYTPWTGNRFVPPTTTIATVQPPVATWLSPIRVGRADAR